MKQIIYYAIVLLVWLLAILTWLIWHFPYPFLALVLLHVIETLFAGISIGIRYGAGGGKSALMCLVFGIAWWLPLIKKMKAETFADVDFLRIG